MATFEQESSNTAPASIPSDEVTEYKTTYDDKEYFIYRSPDYNDAKPKPPFHNDKKMMKVMLNILDTKVDCFVETGSFMGKTIYFVGKNFPKLACYSCELEPEYYRISNAEVKDLPNVKLECVPSPNAVYNIHKNFDSEIYEKKCLFWLDAHWKTDPLYAELLYITKNYKHFIIFIDDFTVPGDDGFWSDGYDIAKIKRFIYKKETLKYYMPNYSSSDEACKDNACGYIIITNMDFETFDNVKEITI